MSGVSGASYVRRRVHVDATAPLDTSQYLAIAAAVAVLGIVVNLVFAALPVARVLWAHWRPAAWRARAELSAEIQLRDRRAD